VEQFANRFNVFSHKDTVYLIDQFRQLRTFDLQTGSLLETKHFDPSYPRLASIARTNAIEIEPIKSPSVYDLPLLANGKKADRELASHLDMAIVDIFGRDDYKYKKYAVEFTALIDTNGNLEVMAIEADEGLPEQKIRDFLASQTFDVQSIPAVLEKWRFNETVFFRNKPASKARREKKQEDLEQREAYLKRLEQDSIYGFYIPQNLGDCFVQLDTMLKYKDRAEMKAKPADEMAIYHHGFGTFLRNNWGLWGGSRLQLYFFERGVYHPDDMSGIILSHYHDWLNGKRDTWKEWENQHPVKEE
jgi:hypothetical protein